MVLDYESKPGDIEAGNGRDLLRGNIDTEITKLIDLLRHF